MLLLLLCLLIDSIPGGKGKLISPRDDELFVITGLLCFSVSVALDARLLVDVESVFLEWLTFESVLSSVSFVVDPRELECSSLPSPIVTISGSVEVTEGTITGTGEGDRSRGIGPCFPLLNWAKKLVASMFPMDGTVGVSTFSLVAGAGG